MPTPARSTVVRKEGSGEPAMALLSTLPACQNIIGMFTARSPGLSAQSTMWQITLAPSTTHCDTCVQISRKRGGNTPKV